MKIPSAAQPKNDQDKARWKEQGLRRRLLTGAHIEDVRQEIESMFSKEIAVDLEINPDLSRNPFLLIWQQLNVAYIEPPEVSVEEDIDLESIVTPKLWAQMQQTSLYALAMGECLVRLDFRHWLADTEVSYRVVTPDVVLVEAMKGQPDKAGKVTEYRTRNGDTITREVWDVRDANEPIFRIEKQGKGGWMDATAEFAPELVDEYPYRDTSGAPILPYILYHNRVGSKLFNWTQGSEISAGALRLAALFTHWGDGFTNAAYPQRYIVDLESPSGRTETLGGQAVDVVTVDRKSILKFKSQGPSGGSLGQFSASMDPLASIEALKVYEQGLAVYAGLNPSDLAVTQSAQSGYAIVVSREGQRRAQKLIEPSLRIGDQELLATAARLSNFYLGDNLPESPRDYSIMYRALMPTPTELDSLAKSLESRLNLGVISQLDAMRELYPEIESDEQAITRLLRIKELEAMLASTNDDTQNTEL